MSVAPETFLDAGPSVREFGPEPLDVPHSGIRANADICLRSVVLLGGSVGRAGFTAAIRRSVLDLPLTSECTVMDRWIAEFSEFRRNLGMVSVRALVDENSPLPSNTWLDKVPQFNVERDPRPYRGTGGLLSDLARGYDFDGWMLVVNAAQVLCMPLSELLDELLLAEGDVRLVADQGGRVAGAMLLDCASLRSVNEVGYCDFKEQVLPGLKTAGGVISVTTLKHQLGLSLRERSTYLDAVAFAHGAATVGQNAVEDGEGWQSRFSIVEPGATVHPTAILHDAVVLADAQVGPHAAVIRSVACAEARISARQVVRDAFLG